MKRVFIQIIIGVLLCFTCMQAVANSPVRTYSRDSMLAHLPVLKSNHSPNKILPEAVELPALIALSYYPELDSVPIRFEYSNIKTTMETRPTLTSSIRNRNRSYIIYIDNLCIANNGILFDSIPFNAQIGLIGHELAHIKYYQEHNAQEIIKLGVNYQVGKFKANYERLTDSMTIAQGLGWQLYDWSQYVFNQSNAVAAYKEYKAKYYLKPDEIAQILVQNPLY